MGCWRRRLAVLGLGGVFTLASSHDVQSAEDRLVLQFDATDERAEFSVPLSRDLVLKVRRAVDVRGHHLGWDLAAADRRLKGYSNFFYDCLCGHGRRPHDYYAWDFVSNHYPSERRLPVYGYPLDVHVRCVECKVTGSEPDARFVAGTVELRVRPLPTANPRQLRIADIIKKGNQKHDVPAPSVEDFEQAEFSRQLEIGKQLVGLHDTQVLRGLERFLSDDDRHVRANAAFVFAGLGDPRGLEALAGILSDRSDRPEGQGVGTARWSLKKQIEADRYYAVHVLAGLKEEGAVSLLLPLLADSEVNYKAAWALGETGSARSVGPLIDALGSGDALVRTMAIQALVKLRAKEALPRLRALLNDQAVPRAGDQVSVAATAKTAILQLER